MKFLMESKTRVMELVKEAGSKVSVQEEVVCIAMVCTQQTISGRYRFLTDLRSHDDGVPYDGFGVEGPSNYLGGVGGGATGGTSSYNGS